MDFPAQPEAQFQTKSLYRRFDLKWAEASRKMQRINGFSGAV